MKLADVIRDVALRLSLSDGECIDPSDEKKILSSLRRVFDSFSIDGRKIPTSCCITLDIPSSKKSYTIGVGKDIDIYAAPIQIESASWVYGTSCQSGVYFDAVLVVRDYPFDFANCASISTHNPQQMAYREKRLIFNGNPLKGSKLQIKAIMPFQVQLDSCIEKTEEKVQFHITPNQNAFDAKTIDSILQEAKQKYDGSNDWKLNTKAYLTTPKCCAVDVCVTAQKISYCANKIDLNSTELPGGYGSALTNIVSYELAPYVGINRAENGLTEDRDRSVKLLHRSNERVRQNVQDYTMPHVSRPYYEEGITTRRTTRW